MRTRLVALTLGLFLSFAVLGCNSKPADSTEMARHFAFRVLAHIGLAQPGAYVWKAEE